MRLGVGNGSGGGLNCGWKPPTESTKVASSPYANSTPISPSIVMKRMCESKSDGKEVEALLVELERPGEVRPAARGSRRPRPGSTIFSTPRIATSPGGISTMTPSERLTSVGSPQPSFAIGPIRNVPCLRREDRPQIADDPRRVGDHVVREHDALDRARAHAVHQRLEEHRAVEADQAADRVQREAEAELDPRRRSRR